MSAQHEVLFETDGRHSSVYLYEPPMGVRQYVEPIDEVLDLGIDTISYVVGDCAVLLYRTEAGERWGHNVELADHEVWYRAAQNFEAFLAAGHDPLMVVCEHAQARGFRFLPHLLLNLHHTPYDRVSDCRVSEFERAHPEWQVGEEPDCPEAEFDNPRRLSFAVPEVRENRMAIVRELLGRYPADGIEVNFHTYAPFIARREVAEHTATLTGWVREIRETCDREAERQGRRKRLVVRAAATLSGNLAMGHDLAAWVGEGLIDTLIAMPVGGDFSSETSRLRELAELTQGTEVTLIAGLDSIGEEQGPLVHSAAVANAYDAGARGILYHRYYPAPHRYPYTAEDYARLRFLAYPDIFAHRDKTFYVGPGPDRPGAVTYGLSQQLPHQLAPGESRTVTLDVADDVAARQEAGELWRCELRVMMHEMLHEDEVRLFWNGGEIDGGEIRRADYVFQMRPGAGTRGYRLHVDLSRGRVPRQGTNELRVELLKKDERLVDPVSVHDVFLVVEYLKHRNALRDDEQYGVQTTFRP